jgi:hypothetical protein
MDMDILEEYTFSIFRVEIYHFCTEDWGSMFLLNVGTHLPDYMVSQSRKPKYESSLPWKPQTFTYCFVLLQN